MHCIARKNGWHLEETKHSETFATAFRRERIVPWVVQWKSDEEIKRLGVTAIEDRVRLRELCKEDEENSRSSFGSLSAGSDSTSRTGDVPLADVILEERVLVPISKEHKVNSLSSLIRMFLAASFRLRPSTPRIERPWALR